MNKNIINAIILFSSIFISSNNTEKEQYEKKLPNFKDILEVKHSIKGRIRLYCKILKDNTSGKKALMNTFSKIPGINEVSINSCIGTILIKYDENTIEPVLIIGIILKVLGLEEKLEKESKSLITKESADILDSLNHTILEKTSGILDLKSALMIFIGTYAIYDIKARPGIRPGGYTCLWWLYSLINRQH